MRIGTMQINGVDTAYVWFGGTPDDSTLFEIRGYQPIVPRPPDTEDYNEAYEEHWRRYPPVTEELAMNYIEHNYGGLSDIVEPDELRGIKRSSGRYPWGSRRELADDEVTKRGREIGIESAEFTFFRNHGDPIAFTRTKRDADGELHTYFQPHPPKPCTVVEYAEAYSINTMRDIHQNSKHLVVEAMSKWSDAVREIFGEKDAVEDILELDRKVLYADDIPVATVVVPEPYRSLRSDAEGLHAHINGQWYPIATRSEVEKWQHLVRTTQTVSDRHHQRYLRLVAELEGYCRRLDSTVAGPAWSQDSNSRVIKNIIEETKNL